MIKIDNIEKCDGCGSCTDNCPAEILKVVNNKISVTDISMCTECGTCEIWCPNRVLLVER